MARKKFSASFLDHGAANCHTETRVLSFLTIKFLLLRSSREMTFGEMPFSEMTMGDFTFSKVAFSDLTIGEPTGHFWYYNYTTVVVTFPYLGQW